MTDMTNQFNIGDEVWVKGRIQARMRDGSYDVGVVRPHQLIGFSPFSEHDKAIVEAAEAFYEGEGSEVEAKQELAQLIFAVSAKRAAVRPKTADQVVAEVLDKGGFHAGLSTEIVGALRSYGLLKDSDG